MMLVIGVIVAVAILGILLVIIQGIQPPGQEAKGVMILQLRDVSSKGIGFSQPQNAQLTSGSTIIVDELVTAVPISPSDIKFSVSDRAKAAYDIKVSGTDNKIEVGKSGTVVVVTCKLTDKYVIQMAHTDEKAQVSNLCETAAR